LNDENEKKGVRWRVSRKVTDLSGKSWRVKRIVEGMLW
jgi:hypothetical protein